ncbi:acetyl-coenzyme A carboxylase carboxyl transferase subunit alpha, chloroplastic-like [Vitis riparia]|uniref:acetyl-coenzyme A carboxylase carboxyl transferase subunit alpha, chloroplastic-like n=1 Tax=Vitis riparia TaxID=96939 RepID=UPI00155A1EA8|nr:acetyl-coenzyme A carboxylase carboxyl transferase subunit alpha, chloroplastic-like [Vitis riparia]XP_034709424.1 acetyl-coenzyme A carboxylase carboxyl transferase subunit alpha, chloroplastic-like [Vitis riparia]XP_034709425.1 acetyl-coenzyme A carboxylase carboxyl transferase subunit alpha, chloroplastic-like [Vitis riparia]
MTTLSLISRNCGSQGGNSDRAIESGLETRIHKDFFAGGLLIGSVRRLNGVWLKNLGSPRIESRNRFHVVAKIRKGKKHDYPWPDDIDPNLSSGHLSYLSYFKPLKEKPKPVTLAFEKPLVDLEKKIVEVRRMADETGLDFSDQISSLESKYQQALKDLYAHLTPIQRLTIARHPNRPTVLDHILNITDKDKWVELHGDRAGYDDPAIVTGIGSIDGKSFMFIGHQKGRNTKENIERNFAMPTPHGYRKALRMMKYADHHGFPIITFIDTPGAFADLKSEELGQGEAIAQNLRTMFSLKVPIISVVTGEGGSGGALAIGCANKLFMLENSAFYVASPEACAAILWKSAQAAPKAAEKLRITAQEHYRLRIADGVIPEPLGGAHADPVWTSQQIKLAITQAMEELGKMDTEELIRHRMLKYRPIGGFQEGIPVDPERKRNMKLSDLNAAEAGDIESELEELKKKILEAEGPSEPITSQTIKKLEEDVDQEITNAFISMGLQEKLESLQLELSKAPDVPNNQTLNWALKEKVDRIMQEFDHNLTRPGAYLGLKQKLEMLNMAHRLIEHKEKAEKLKAEINQKVPAEVKAKMEVLKEAQQKLSKGDPFDKDLVEEVEKAKNELKEVLKSANLEIIGMTKRNVPPPPPDLAENIAKVNEEIGKEIERAINVTGLNGKIEELKAEVAKGSSSETVEKLKAEIQEQITAVMDVTTLKEKFENLNVDLASHAGTADNGRL